MTAIVIVAVALPLLAALLFVEVRPIERARAPVKGTLSALFIITAILHQGAGGAFYIALLAGLSLSLCGDVLLAFDGKKPFMAGLVAFLLGHVAYVVAFASLATFNDLTWMGAVPTVLMSVIVFLWLKPNLGKMLGPVAAYVLVITVMVVAAWTVLGTEVLPIRGRALVLTGALLFYISDIFVARNKFVKESNWNRLIGLPVYYAGQFLLAFSPALLVVGDP